MTPIIGLGCLFFMMWAIAISATLVKFKKQQRKVIEKREKRNERMFVYLDGIEQSKIDYDGRQQAKAETGETDREAGKAQ